MDHKSFVLKWVDAFNRGDADTLAEMYAEDAINHQVAKGEVQGRENIKTMFRKEFSAAKMTCIVENIFADGDVGILEWKDPCGVRGCGFFHIQNNQIQFQRGYWDKLSFLKAHHLPMPENP